MSEVIVILEKYGEDNRIQKSIQSKKLLIGVTNKNKASYYAALNYFYETVGRDVIDRIPGRLYVGGSYMQCYVIASRKTNWEDDVNVLDNEIELVSDNPVWITEKSFSFHPSSSAAKAPGSSFPFDFPFDFAGKKKGAAWLQNDHYADSHFKMTIYGESVNPKVTIGGYTYAVRTTVEKNEYLVIDSREGTVVRVQQNGTKINEFDNRSRAEQGVFKKIPEGKLNVNWSGDFGFDVLLYQERSEPQWS